jgi:hypothetical protein
MWTTTPQKRRIPSMCKSAVTVVYFENVFGSTWLILCRRDSTMAAAVEVLFASVNPSVVKDSLLHNKVVAVLKQTQRLEHPGIGIQRAVYKGVAGLFEGLKQANAGEDVASGPEVADSLKIHLFRQDAGSEAVRLLRAKAIVAAVEYSPSLMEQAKSDPSSAVRDLLHGAPQ